jgi:hypothetical protein
MKVLPLILIVSLASAAQSYGSDIPEIEGWTAQSVTQIYDPEDLWQAINGAADLFLSYDFQQLRAQELSSDDVTIVLEIYDMHEPLNAFGIYRMERSVKAKMRKIGAEAIVTAPYQCLLFKGRHYVKIEAHRGKFTEKEGIDLLEAIADSLPGGEGLPEELDLLPVKDRIPGSEGFEKAGHLGLGDLKDCIFARYKIGNEQEYEVFVLFRNSRDAVESTWKALSSGKWTKAEDSQLPILLRTIPYRGVVGLIQTSGGILGIAGIETEKDVLKMLQDLAKSQGTAEPSNR